MKVIIADLKEVRDCDELCAAVELVGYMLKVGTKVSKCTTTAALNRLYSEVEQ